jgi:hypothetical protein
MMKAKELWLALRKGAKPLHDALMKALAQQKPAVVQTTELPKPAPCAKQTPGWYKPEKIYYTPPDGVSPDGLGFPPRESQETSYMGRSAAFQRLMGRARR